VSTHNRVDPRRFFFVFLESKRLSRHKAIAMTKYGMHELRFAIAYHYARKARRFGKESVLKATSSGSVTVAAENTSCNLTPPSIEFPLELIACVQNEKVKPLAFLELVLKIVQNGDKDPPAWFENERIRVSVANTIARGFASSELKSEMASGVRTSTFKNKLYNNLINVVHNIVERFFFVRLFS
jgi:hypothetical protein